MSVKNAMTGVNSESTPLEVTHCPGETVGELVDVAPEVKVAADAYAVRP